jgi:hypothetical protein
MLNRSIIGSKIEYGNKKSHSARNLLITVGTCALLISIYNSYSAALEINSNYVELNQSLAFPVDKNPVSKNLFKDPLDTSSNTDVALNSENLKTKLSNGLPFNISYDVEPENVTLDQKILDIASNLTVMELTGELSLPIDKTVKVNSKYSDSDSNYNICTFKPHMIKDGKIVGPLGKGGLESDLNKIYLEYSQNFTVNDRVCTLTKDWKNEVNKLNTANAADDFDDISDLIGILSEYLQRF